MQGSAQRLVETWYDRGRADSRGRAFDLMDLDQRDCKLLSVEILVVGSTKRAGESF